MGLWVNTIENEKRRKNCRRLNDFQFINSYKTLKLGKVDK